MTYKLTFIDAVQKAQNSLVEWDSHGCRIIKASPETKQRTTMNVNQCKTIANNRDEHNEDQFPERMQSVL